MATVRLTIQNFTSERINIIGNGSCSTNIIKANLVGIETAAQQYSVSHLNNNIGTIGEEIPKPGIINGGPTNGIISGNTISQQAQESVF